MTENKNIVIGTAGHIDHGKTTLVKALTGIDTDSLKEEKARGITIDLGFAPLLLPDGVRTSIIDVPGHERFIKNMLAGAAGIDLALLIIAADEGIMPQTKEHLDIINLLEIKDLIAVITKTDIADLDILELVEEETRELLKGTNFHNTPLVRVSAETGFGIDILLAVIKERIEMIQPRGAEYNFSRLPIDRVFTVHGFGTVATGTLFNGEINIGDILESATKGVKVRVRNIQIHGSQVSKAYAGQRAAINLAGVERNELARGDVLASPGRLSASGRIDVSCHLLKSSPIELHSQTRVRFFQGTRETLGRVYFFDRTYLAPGEEAFLQIALEEPIAVLRGDNYIIRSYSPVTTIGGGRIIEPQAQKHKKKDTLLIEELQTKAEGNKAKLAYQYIEKSKGIVTSERISIYLGADQYKTKKYLKILETEGKITALEISDEGTGFIAVAALDNWAETISREIKTSLHEAPLSPGMDKEVLRGKHFAQWSLKEFSALLNYLAEKQLLQIGSGRYLLPWGYQVDANNVIYLMAQEAAHIYDNSGWQGLAWDTIREQLKLDDRASRQIQRYLIQNGLIIQLDNDLYVSSKTIEEGKKKLGQWLESHGEVTIAQARDLLGSTRKTTVPLLEYLDKLKYTVRIGDKRVLFDTFHLHKL